MTTANEHKLYVYGQSNPDGWACEGCSWQGPHHLDRTQARERHDSETGTSSPELAWAEMTPLDQLRAIRRALGWGSSADPRPYIAELRREESETEHRADQAQISARMVYPPVPPESDTAIRHYAWPLAVRTYCCDRPFADVPLWEPISIMEAAHYDARYPEQTSPCAGMNR